MSRVVLSFTEAQVKALRRIAESGRSQYSDYGAAEGLVRRGLVVALDHYSRKFKLTPAGKLCIELLDALAKPEGNS